MKNFPRREAHGVSQQALPAEARKRGEGGEGGEGGESGRVGQIVEFTPSRPRHYYLVLMTDAGSVPCSTLGDKWPKRWTFGQKQGHLFRLRCGIEPFSFLFPDDFVPALGWC